MTHKKRKKKRISCFELLDALRAEGFSCSLGVLYRVVGIKKNAIFNHKNIIFFQLNFSIIFGHQNPGSRTGSGSAIRKKCWIQIWILIKSMRICNPGDNRKKRNKI
jgi:hypothetical protein